MSIPIDKLLSVPQNRYEYTVAAIQLIDKTNGATINGEEYESWKIVPKVLHKLLEGDFQYCANQTDAYKIVKEQKNELENRE